MASAVATPLERQFGRIAGITEMSSTSYLGSTSITHSVRPEPQHRCGRPRRAGGDQRGSRANCRPTCPANRPSARVNPADARDSDSRADVGHPRTNPRFTTRPTRSSRKSSRRSTASGRSSSAAVRLRPCASRSIRRCSIISASGLDDVRNDARHGQRQSPERTDLRPRTAAGSWAPIDQLLKAAEYRPLIIAYRNGAPVRISDVATVSDSVEDVRASGFFCPGRASSSPRC